MSHKRTRSASSAAVAGPPEKKRHVDERAKLSKFAFEQVYVAVSVDGKSRQIECHGTQHHEKTRMIEMSSWIQSRPGTDVTLCLTGERLARVTVTVPDARNDMLVTVRDSGTGIGYECKFGPQAMGVSIVLKHVTVCLPDDLKFKSDLPAVKAWRQLRLRDVNIYCSEMGDIGVGELERNQDRRMVKRGNLVDDAFPVGSRLSFYVKEVGTPAFTAFDRITCNSVPAVAKSKTNTRIVEWSSMSESGVVFKAWFVRGTKDGTSLLTGFAATVPDWIKLKSPSDSLAGWAHCRFDDARIILDGKEVTTTLNDGREVKTSTRMPRRRVGAETNFAVAPGRFNLRVGICHKDDAAAGTKRLFDSVWFDCPTMDGLDRGYKTEVSDKSGASFEMWFRRDGDKVYVRNVIVTVPDEVKVLGSEPGEEEKVIRELLER